uniref:Uncharacterized protein n=1 Tax=Solanum lycopersicum TaxID=4081 RepID=A0A3Q7FAK9_SOLLC
MKIWRVSSVDVQSNMLSLELNNCCLAWHFRRWFIQALRLPDVYTVKVSPLTLTGLYFTPSLTLIFLMESCLNAVSRSRNNVFATHSLLRQLDHQLYPISESGPEWLAGRHMFGDALLPSECSLIVEELKQTSLSFQVWFLPFCSFSYGEDDLICTRASSSHCRCCPVGISPSSLNKLNASIGAFKLSGYISGPDVYTVEVYMHG